MGSPGAAMIPTVIDGATKRKKKKEGEKQEEDTKESLDKWSTDARDRIVDELERIYTDGKKE